MIKLPDAIRTYFDAANNDQYEAFISSFREDAYVIDFNREFKGLNAVSDWSKNEIFGAKVRFRITEAALRDESYSVTVSIDGDFDKTNLPDPFLLKHSFKLSDGKIKELVVSQP